MSLRIVSGGQTGADRAALDVARALGLPHGGFVPKGRWAEDGPVPDCYEMTELPTTNLLKRTERNVMESDATLLLSHGALTGGSAATAGFARRHGKPLLHLDLDQLDVAAAARVLADWLRRTPCGTLNVAGPRASKDAGIYEATRSVLDGALAVRVNSPPNQRR